MVHGDAERAQAPMTPVLVVESRTGAAAGNRSGLSERQAGRRRTREARSARDDRSRLSL